jgi:hemerythrin
MSVEGSIPDWKKGYEIGVNDVDFQHKYFLKLIKLFYLRGNLDMQKELIVSHLNEIILYVRFHFCSEENLMGLHNHSVYQQYRLKYVGSIQILSNKLGLLKLNELGVSEIVLFMIDWFLEHTVKEDIKLSPFFKNRSIYDSEKSHQIVI